MQKKTFCFLIFILSVLSIMSCQTKKTYHSKKVKHKRCNTCPHFTYLYNNQTIFVTENGQVDTKGV
ncbi:MAG: hypothetical protein J5606_10640, partial [Bacteroidales bacterium]|nr:hypothetical protein [Bacteroidales bacterium]